MVFSIVCSKNNNSQSNDYEKILEEFRTNSIKCINTNQKVRHGLRGGIHFAELNEDLVRDIVAKLQNMSFKSYTAFCKIDEKDKYTKTDYINLLRSCIDVPFKTNSIKPTVKIEQNDKIKESEIRNCLKGLNGVAKFEILNKKDKCILLSLPDIMLGIFGRYRKECNNPKVDRNKTFYNSLLNKYNAIVDFDTKKTYGRKNIYNPCGVINT